MKVVDRAWLLLAEVKVLSSEDRTLQSQVDSANVSLVYHS